MRTQATFTRPRRGQADPTRPTPSVRRGRFRCEEKPAPCRAQLSAKAARDEQALTLRSAVDSSLALFGLIDGGDLSVESVAERDADGVLAYYEPATKSITVIQRASATNRREANATLLHEMIHALQDTAHDLMVSPQRTLSSSRSRTIVSARIRSTLQHAGPATRSSDNS